MTRDEARNLLSQTPEFVPGPCADCGADTIEGAAEKCRPHQLPCGDWVCSTPEDCQPESGPLLQRNPEYDHIDGYLWGWFAFDDGMTKSAPTWQPFNTNH